MAAMCGGSAGDDGGDDGRQPNKECRDSWNCHMIAGVFFKKKMKTRRWSRVGRDGSKVVLRLNNKRVPEGHEGCFLRQVNGKLVKARLFDIGPRSWRMITKVEKDHAFDNYIRVSTLPFIKITCLISLTEVSGVVLLCLHFI
ncbi:hypothetical protein LINPERPRIM_LOCUS21982 [Linum perenne]